MTQAIVTKYLPATNTKGSRIKASCEAGSVTIGYPHQLRGEDCYRAAADALCAKLGWTGKLHGGGVKNGYVFVFEKLPRTINPAKAARDAAHTLVKEYVSQFTN